jgi:hypothetical protein
MLPRWQIASIAIILNVVIAGRSLRRGFGNWISPEAKTTMANN